MATDPLYQPITADEFLAMDFATDRKFELVDGVIHMMTGGTETHAWVQANLVAWLRPALRGSGCRSYGSEMAIQVSGNDIRYPDVSVHCGPRPDHGTNVRALETPTIVIEVLSSTATYDMGTKLEEYKALTSVELVGLIDPVNELVRTVRRIKPSAWFDTMFAAHDLAIPSLGLTIPHSEIFARD